MDSTFGVTAFIEDALVPYMGTTTSGIKIISDGTNWQYDNNNDIAYWPLTSKIRFYGYTPFVNPSMTDLKISNTKMTFDYVVVDEVRKHIDLMYAYEYEGKPTTSESVQMNFKHALTQIHFRVGTSKPTLKVDIEENGIVLKNIANSGTFSFERENTAASWTVGSSITNYVVPTYAVNDVSFEEEGEEDSKKQKFTQLSILDNAVMLLPQALTAKSDAEANGAYFTISCKLYQVDADGAFKGYLFGDADNFAELEIPIGTTWGRNQIITYNLNIGEGGQLSPITFTTDVVEWDNVEGGTIINP